MRARAAPSSQALTEFDRLDRQLARLRARVFQAAARSSPHLLPLLNACPSRVSLDFRPMLFRCAFEVGGVRFRGVLPIALALQLTNTATLVIDDILDHAVRRDGKPCIHTRFGVERAVLLSVLLKSIASQLILDLKKIPAGMRTEVCRQFEAAWADVHRGQYLDLYSSQRWTLDEATHLRTIYLTTGRLIEVSMVIGGLLGGVTRRHARALASFGKCFGLIHQLRDDLVEYWPKKYQLGRPAGEDLRERKPRLPIIYGLRPQSPIRCDLQRLLKQQTMAPRDVLEVRSLLLQCGAFAQVRQRIEQLHREARRSLDRLPVGRSTAILGLLLAYITENDKAAVGSDRAPERSGHGSGSS
jgi:geranylgeranyl pyrophosphate synthase